MLTIYKHLIFIILICFNKFVFSADNAINLKDLDNDPGLVNTSGKKGPVQTVKAIPVSRNKYKTVKDGDKIIYQCSGDSEGIDSVSVTQFYDKFRLMYISLTTADYYVTESLFFVQCMSDWHLIDQDIHDILSDACLNERNLEIVDFDNDGSYIVDEHNLHGLKGTGFIPKDEVQVVGVFHKGKPIWTAKDQSNKCTSVIVHGELQLTTLVNVNVIFQTDEELSSDGEEQQQPYQSESEKGQEPEQKQPDLPKLLEKLEVQKNEKLEELKKKLKQESKTLEPGQDLCLMSYPTILRSIFDDEENEEQKSQEATSTGLKETELENQLFYEYIDEKWTKVSKSKFYSRLNELDTEMMAQSKEEEATE
ncbi:hypothetical protein TpMuguga_02g00213 [Theileria parva strain Muguga]|uniref:Uncharacterized protein n=1 Tax=Theileria parva TaxID=5875 RepID=Q4N5S8_THEPA|nr:uncharacterized protein TpMuguga_02g00213 [Theileria parva strain Muguga]EAN32495.1 hypothetical protein TpMuguga_02g00213 [Theileria parva strain Muguga]|eukprot:XP_764778.1 hypothetical protein [Theileria parva strain Muguga]